MRASRLLNLLMTLQASSRVSAARLAEELRVSVRTIHRDVEELSAAGVPVVAHRGAEGGFSLLDGWRTRLTGLTPEEAQAVMLSGVPHAAADLGIGAAAASAQLKVLAALPAHWHDDAKRVASRFHLDPLGWYRKAEGSPHLQPIAQAVWDDRRIRIRYDSWKGVVERRVDPLGLVMKAGEWYLVAAAERSVRTYKIANILSLEIAKERFARKRKFDLARYWAESIERFEAGIYQGTATIRVSPSGRRALRYFSGIVAQAAETSASPPDRRGWTTHAIPIESVEHAAGELLKLGAECEVIEPEALRSRVSQAVRALGKLYRVAPS